MSSSYVDEELDTDVSHYSQGELMAVLDIPDLDPKKIRDRVDTLISEFRDVPEYVSFFMEAQDELLHAATLPPADEEDTGYAPADEQTSEWYHNEVLQQSDPTQTSKLTDRQQKVQVYGDQHATMNREQIATTDTYDVPVKQDTLNPNLKNTIKRFVNLDSQFRDTPTATNSTQYTCNLSDTLKDVLVISLYSYQIPFSWYVIDPTYGNTCCWLTTETAAAVPVTVPAGNYTHTAFVSALQDALASAGVVGGGVAYNASTGKLTLQFGTATVDGAAVLAVVFFDFESRLQCVPGQCAKSNHRLNNTLGWLMGFRSPAVLVLPDGNVGDAMLDLTGPKYLLLSLDDYNQNHVNNSLVSIARQDRATKAPPYSGPLACLPPRRSNQAALATQDGWMLANKYENDFTWTPQAVPSAPRTWTNAQLFSWNAIQTQRNNLTSFLTDAPTTPDILAVLPVKTSTGVPTGTLLVEFSGSLQDNERTYFGPVNIERLGVKLLDDRGNVVNLNGVDWCVTLIAECLYQY